MTKDDTTPATDPVLAVLEAAGTKPYRLKEEHPNCYTTMSEDAYVGIELKAGYGSEPAAFIHAVNTFQPALDALRTLLAQADRSAGLHAVDWKDHACAECDGSIPREGFRCSRHAAHFLLAKMERPS